MGGDKMVAEGADIWNNYKNTAYMGYVNVMNLRSILNLMEQCKQDIQQWNPDVVILVDYPDLISKLQSSLITQELKFTTILLPKFGLERV